jgi:hypothetical protein
MAKTRIGCGFLLVSAVLTCVLLGINGLIVMNLVNAVLPTLPEGWRQPRVAQAAVFLGPLALLLIEWWICDVAIDWLRPMRRSTDKG